MLTNKQIRMLQLLDKQVGSCQRCKLHKNGKAIPYWTPDSKYAIIAESPGYSEIRQQTPFSGAAGKILTDVLEKKGFDSKDFLIINSIQCRPVVENRNAKPTEGQLVKCQDHVRKYIKVVNPEKILCLGNYAKYIFTGNTTGVLRQRGVFRETVFYHQGGVEYPVLYTIHPAYCIYNAEEGIPILMEDIQLFKDTKFEKESDWFFGVEEFLI